MGVYEELVIMCRELKRQEGLKSAQKNVHDCTVFVHDSVGSGFF